MPRQSITILFPLILVVGTLSCDAPTRVPEGPEQNQEELGVLLVNRTMELNSKADPRFVASYCSDYEPQEKATEFTLQDQVAAQEFQIIVRYTGSGRKFYIEVIELGDTIALEYFDKDQLNRDRQAEMVFARANETYSLIVSRSCEESFL